MTETRFDAVFLSFDEPLADALYGRLREVFGPVKRLHGVKGMRRAYALTAELVDTDQYFIADGDFEIHADFPATDAAPLTDGTSMRVWQTVNPVTGLVYGYGGLKLVRRSAIRDMGVAVDVLAAVPGRVEFARTVAGATRFDQSPYHAWKAGFRECAMLAHGCEYGSTSPAEADERIAAWLGASGGPHAAWAARGAADGTAFAAKAQGEDDFQHINDPAWLTAAFDAAYGEGSR